MAKKTHVFKYVKTNDFKTSKITGVVGGFNTRDFLDINFFVETIDLPKSVKHDVREDGAISAEPHPSAPTSETVSIREIPFAVSLDLEAAKSVVQWMQKQINTFEIQKAKRQPITEPIKD